MSEEEFEEYLSNNIAKDFYENNILHLINYSSGNRVRSIRRAIKRGHMSVDGILYPKRPFNNTKSKKGSINDKKKEIYGRLKHRQK